MIDLLHEIWQTMRNNKARTALTGIAVAWGVFMLIVLLGMSQGVLNAFADEVAKGGANYISVHPGVTSEPWHGHKLGRAIGLKDSDTEAIQSRGGEKVKDVTGKIYGPSVTISTHKDYVSTSYQGVYPSDIKRRKIEMYAGRYINSRDMDESRKVVVMDLPLAKNLFDDPEQAVGQTVKLSGIAFAVVGVIDSDADRPVVIPYSTAKLLANRGESTDALDVEIQDVTNAKEAQQVEANVRQTLAATHEFNPDDSGAIYIWNRFTQQESMGTAIHILHLAVWVIGIFTLLSGIIGVSNIMFVSVRERTHEIGIRRAIGAKPRSIIRQIIWESVAITTLFGYVGIVLGTALTALLTHLIGEQPFLHHPGTNLAIAFEVTLTLVVAGALAGLFPALKALKVKPVEALRDE